MTLICTFMQQYNNKHNFLDFFPNLVAMQKMCSIYYTERDILKLDCTLLNLVPFCQMAQRNLPTKHESERKGLNSKKVLERRVEIF